MHTGFREAVLPLTLAVTNAQSVAEPRATAGVKRFGGDTARASAVYAGTVPLTADDIAEAASRVVNLPAHMNINRMEIMPTGQAPGPLAIKRG